MLSTFKMINGLLEILELLTLRSKIILFVHAINEYKKPAFPFIEFPTKWLTRKVIYI